MIRLKFIFLLILLFSITINSQTKIKIFGKVTFLSTQYVYLKFNSTEKINQGDTLFTFADNQPAGIVKYKSSTSVACQRLKPINIGDTLFALIEIQNDDSEKKIDSINLSDSTLITQGLEIPESIQRPLVKKNYNLRMSIQSYGDLNDIENTNRYRYSFNYEQTDFVTKGLHFESYFIVNYSKKRYSTKNNFKDLLKIYALNFDYKISDNQTMTLGRSLNPYVFSIGSIDGIQYLYKLGSNTFGAILGSRPDYFNYWFQPKLVQMGVFYNRIDSINSRAFENTLGFIEQTNKFKPDRRYFYFQHRNDIIPFTNFFFSSELDFYFVNKGIITRKVNLSSLYSMLTVRPHKILSMNLSYDSRRNVYYLESFKNTIDTLIENELRQGFRVSAILRPFPLLFVNIQYSRREIRKDIKPTNNFGTTIGFNNLPLIRTNISLSYNKYTTTFIQGNNYSVYLTKNLLNDFLLTGNFRLYQFRQLQNNFLFIDRFLEVGLFTNLFKNLSFSINFEQKLNNQKSSYLMIDFTNRF